MPLRRADEILDWLLARQPDERILEKTTGLPYGWGLWLRALTPLPRPPRATGVVTEMLQRPAPVPTGRLPALGFVQAVRRLFWQTWEPAPRDQRWMRWTSALISALLHVLFAVLLLWVALVRTPVDPEEGGEGNRIQVAFVGKGTPAEDGGGASSAEAVAANAPATQIDATAAGASAQAATLSPSPAAEPTDASASAAAPPPAAAEPAPPAEATPANEQPLQATVVQEATTDFVVPPPSVPRTEVRVVPREPQDVTVRERTVAVVETPVARSAVPLPVLATPPRDRTPEVSVREREVTLMSERPVPMQMPQSRVEATVPQRELQVREREVQPAPTAPVAMAPVPQREVNVRGAAAEIEVRERSIPNAAPRPAPSAPTVAAAGTSTSAATTSSPSTTSAPVRDGPAASAPASSRAGTQLAPQPGSWATPQRGDDWGADAQARDGARRGAQQANQAGTGLFNADGSVRVPGDDGKGDHERGAPGGDKDGWSRERIAQSGTWLKRPPYDYTPTSFDKYWAPNESLLAEWVRKGIKAVEIPIPGTSTKISCVVSMLQFGGGCGLTNPNMNDQPAVARPPPDIPFKKELQEDNGSR